MRRLFRGGVYLRAASISGNTVWGRTYLGSTACSKGIKLNVCACAIDNCSKAHTSLSLYFFFLGTTLFVIVIHMCSIMKSPSLCGRDYYRPYWKILLSVSCPIFSDTVTYRLFLPITLLPPLFHSMYAIFLATRYEFVPCNRRDHYVIEIHVKAGLPSEIYTDRENKVNIFTAWHTYICIVHTTISYRCG